jgi:hypothetical protein|tara:strand:+ start:822 stop:1475 length:654 start_codon:yes stop_codon:yes gene_type:complete
VLLQQVISTETSKGNICPQGKEVMGLLEYLINGPLEKSKKRIIKGNPGASSLFDGLNLVFGKPEMENYAEYYPADEPGAPGNPNPYFGIDTLSVNPSKATTDERLDEIVLGEAMHRLPTTYPSLYRQFTGNPSSGYTGRMKQRHQRIGDPRQYDQWLKTSGHDAMIRGAVLGDMPQHSAAGWGGLLSQFPFSQDQYMALQEIKKSVAPKKRKKKKSD